MSKKSDKESKRKAKVEAKLSVVNEKVTYFSYLPFFRHRKAIFTVNLCRKASVQYVHCTAQAQSLKGIQSVKQTGNFCMGLQNKFLTAPIGTGKIL